MKKKRKTKSTSRPAEFIAHTSNQDKLFDVPTSPENEWRGMPEYVSERLEPYRKIIVRFRNQEDVDAFAKAIGQDVSASTMSLWFPRLRWTRFGDHWVDEDES